VFDNQLFNDNTALKSVNTCKHPVFGYGQSIKHPFWCLPAVADIFKSACLEFKDNRPTFALQNLKKP